VIKVLVVDDSAFMRKAISTMLAKDPQIMVIDTARNGEEALQKVRLHNPDVVTMDIEMPVMDGLTALKQIMADSPRPVLMVSSLTTEGAEATLKAMDLGAVDFIPKQLSKVSLDIIKIEESLQAKVKAVATRRQSRAAPQRPRPEFRPPVAPPRRTGGKPLRDVVCIGVSTGGPPAVQRLLSDLPEDLPASILIAQHMPQAFTGPFAKRLNAFSKLSVKEAENGDQLRNGSVYIAQGGQHMRLRKTAGHLEIEIVPGGGESLYRPSANVLIGSTAEILGWRALGIVLTGMGNDGLEGARQLKERGGRLLAQSESTCVVYGMPRAVVDAGLADEVIDIEDMGRALVDNLFR
jgi:two-component system, chemotaxis family, protein-glutamate methylesterase/glutaminase